MMSAKQIQVRRKLFFSNKPLKRIEKEYGGFLSHVRGYHRGDIRCSKCDKFVNPNNPIETIEIAHTEGGRMFHDKRFCTTNGYGVAFFSLSPRCRRKRGSLNEKCKRY